MLNYIPVKLFLVVISIVVPASICMATDIPDMIIYVDSSGNSLDENAAASAPHITQDVNTFTVELRSKEKLYVVNIIESSADVSWERIGLNKFEAHGLERNDEVWITFECMFATEVGSGGGKLEDKYASLSDIDFDADTTHMFNKDEHYKPEGNLEEDQYEYPEFPNGGVLGLIIPLNDDNDNNWDERDNVKGLDPEGDDDEIVQTQLSVQAMKSGTWDIINSKTNIYDADGKLIEDIDRHLERDKEALKEAKIWIEANEDVNSGDKRQFMAKFKPDEAAYSPGHGHIGRDFVKAVFVGVDFDVPANWNTFVEHNNLPNEGNDFLENHPDTNGFDVYMGINWPMNGAACYIRRLNLNQADKPLWDSLEPEVRITYISGTGGIRLYSWVSMGKVKTYPDDENIIVVLDSVGDKAIHIKNKSIWDLIYGDSDERVAMYGITAGEAVIAVQLLFNGEIFHEDRVKIIVESGS